MLMLKAKLLAPTLEGDGSDQESVLPDPSPTTRDPTPLPTTRDPTQLLNEDEEMAAPQEFYR